jgi:diketogulonate reductase-like aldo/keto reductase
MVNQLHFSCLHQQEVSPALRQLCQATGITLVAYLPLERGAVMEHAGIKSVAVQLGMSSAQLALAWLLSQQALPIPRALQSRHIEQNNAASTVRLVTGDIMHVGSLGRLP